MSTGPGSVHEPRAGAPDQKPPWTRPTATVLPLSETMAGSGPAPDGGGGFFVT
jgi:hypothetical protein